MQSSKTAADLETQVVSVSLEADLTSAARELRTSHGRVSISELDAANFAGKVTSKTDSNDLLKSKGGFLESYEAELDRIGDALTATGRGIESDARALLLKADALGRTRRAGTGAIAGIRGSSDSWEDNEGSSGTRRDVHSAESPSTGTSIPAHQLAASVTDLRSRAESLSNRLLRLRVQTEIDAAEFRRLASRADDELRLGASTLTERRLASDPWTLDSTGGIVVVLLSDVYTIVRALEGRLETKAEGMRKDEQGLEKTDDNSADRNDDDKDGDGKWAPPSSFERVTTKYWVDEQHLYEVLLSSIASLPLLVYGRRGGRLLDQREARRSSMMDMQRNAAAARVRSDPNGIRGSGSLWTSSLATSISSVYFDSPDLRMYSERLKRSEGAQLFRIRWYGPRKPQGDEVVYLELKTHHERWIADASVKERVAIRERDVPEFLDVAHGNGSWDEDRVAETIRMANPTEDQGSIRDLSNLLLKMRDVIHKFNLTPCVRTKYTRVALQSTTSNKLRLTLDRDITVVNERAAAPSSSFWCLEDNDSISTDAVVKLPYCVFEVKVAGADGPPPFITQLENRDTIVEARKFSKFLSGASIFNANNITTLPWWASDDAFIPLYNKKDVGPTIASTANYVPAFSALDDTTRTIMDSVPFVVGPAIANAASCNKSNCSSPTSSTSGIEEKPLPVNKIEGSGRSQRRRTRQSILQRVSLPRMSLYLQNEDSPFDKRIAPKTPVRVEPKSHFANERTFIQWISAALLLITVSQLLYILAAQSKVKEAGIAGTFLIAMSLFITLYALAIYYRRVYLMKNAKPYGYIDFAGPGILTASIVSGVILLIVYSYRASKQPSAEPTISTMIHQPGQCIRRSLDGAPIMEMQPSGVAIDESKGLALVPSLNRILALRDGLPTEEENSEPVRVVATLPGANIEALEFVGDDLYALSEEGESSHIIALEWVNGDLQTRFLREIHRWKLPLPGAEGMAVIPGEEGISVPKLVVAGDLTPGKRGGLSIHVLGLNSFDVTSDTLEKNAKMNTKLVSRGLRDEKVGSMQYFEGLLYILFDNDRVIRAFDTKTGTVVQETVLPVAEIGSEFDWEGMRLQRINESSDGLLRGSNTSDTSLVLHLALDTPAQVWSIRLNEIGGDTPSQRWTLPECAPPQRDT